MRKIFFGLAVIFLVVFTYEFMGYVFVTKRNFMSQKFLISYAGFDATMYDRFRIKVSSVMSRLIQTQERKDDGEYGAEYQNVTMGKFIRVDNKNNELFLTDKYGQELSFYLMDDYANADIANLDMIVVDRDKRVTWLSLPELVVNSKMFENSRVKVVWPSDDSIYSYVMNSKAYNNKLNDKLKKVDKIIFYL